MKLQILQLKAIAQAAGGHAWHQYPGEPRRIHISSTGPGVFLNDAWACPPHTSEQWSAVSRHIAAACPATMIFLVDHIKALEEALYGAQERFSAKVEVHASVALVELHEAINVVCDFLECDDRLDRHDAVEAASTLRTIFAQAVDALPAVAVAPTAGAAAPAAHFLSTLLGVE